MEIGIKKKFFKLNCCNEKIWKGTIDYNNNYKNFEFKFVLLSNNNVIKFQDGENNKFEIDNLKEKRGKYNRYEYEYINDELILKCKW